MSVKISRNDAAHMLAFGVAYFLVASATMLWARFDGGFAKIWIGAALMLAQMMRMDSRRWWRVVVPAAIGCFTAASMFGLGIKPAIPLTAINMGEAVLGAGLLRHFGKRDDYLASLGNVGLFVLAAGLVAPLVSGVLAGGIAAVITGQAFYHLGRDWFMGHALGMLVFAPPATMFLRGELSEWARGLSTRRRFEAIGLFAAMLGICVIGFGQEKLPLLFLPMLPMIVITFHLDRVGAALAVVMLVLVGTLLTALGHGPLHSMSITTSQRSVYLIFYFAMSVLTVLPAAAELRQRRDIFRRLHESEARYKLLTENASDIVLEIDAKGIVRYVSPSVKEVAGFSPEQLVGHRPLRLTSAPDARTFLAAYRALRQQPGLSSAIEYRAPDAYGILKWFEARTRGIVDDRGNLTGSVSVIRDVSHRKSLEMQLAHAATTDPLTGLGNRRAFDMLLDQRIDDCRTGLRRGCVAVFDLDHFKLVNDQFGHDIGDRVLESFAATALGIVRAQDYVARLGGEEFGVILDGVDLAQAEQICDRLRQMLAQQTMRTVNGASVSITTSAGIAAIKPALSRDQIMKAADDALYCAKDAGRDRLAIAA